MITGFHRYFKTLRPSGMALIITLSTLVLVSVLILAFFSRAQFNRQVSFSSTNLLKAEMLGRSAVEIVVGEIRDEISSAAASNISNGGVSSYPSIYVPITPADSLPRQLGVSSATGPLVKVSGNSIPVRPNGNIQGSSISIATPSRNNRFISSSHWFTSGNSATISNPQLGSQSVLPTWLFVTRGNDIKTPASIDTARDPSSEDYVIGRFAYTVYDIGSLLDANVAGYPAVAASDAGYKASAAYAELASVGLGSTNTFVSWRNAVTGTSAASFKEWAIGVPGTGGILNSASVAAARSGHTEAVCGDNAVFSRRDLLKNSLLTGSATKLLTHFSRSANAPSAIPATVTGTNPNLANLRVATSGTGTHYRDDGTTDTYSIEAGDPLLQRRFSLAKLAWIGHGGPNTAAFASSLGAADRKKAIEDCFGLDWDSTNNGWTYNDGKIKPLSDVASLKREPNFFELLKAGIVEGSIGKSSSVDSAGVPTNMAYSDQTARESIKDQQIFKIGLNIIDSAKSDNYPSTLFCTSGVPVPIHGTADLPYLSNVLTTTLCSYAYVDGTTASMKNCSAVVIPELFNPNRSSANTTSGPSKIQIHIVKGTLDRIYLSTGELNRVPSPNIELDALDPIIISSSNFDKYRSGIKAVYDTEATSSTTLASKLGNAVITGTTGNFHGFNFYTYSSTTLPANFTNGSGVIRAIISNLVIAVEYWDDLANKWQVYDTLVGNENASLTGISKPSVAKGNVDFAPGPTKLTAPGATITRNALDNSCWNITKIDPRTSRLGVSSGQGIGPTLGQNLSQGAFCFNMPFGGDSNHNLSAGVYPGLWIQGKKKDWTDSDGTKISNVADPDTNVRPADGWLDQTQTSASKTNLYANVSNTTNACRPILLHRPFQNVAELGYVFRDSPWKSLSFFDEISGDSALLDLFSIADEPTVAAGRVALNTTQTAVQEALLTNAGQNVDGSNALASPSGIVSGYNSYAFSSGIPTASMPLSIAGITKFMSSSQLESAYSSGTTPIKTMRESVVRALAGSTQTRTWNLLIDVVAQAGRYPTTVNSAHSLNDFIVEGESRYWLSIAIDRYTGKVISQQLEPVNE